MVKLRHIAFLVTIFVTGDVFSQGSPFRLNLNTEFSAIVMEENILSNQTNGQLSRLNLGFEYNSRARWGVRTLIKNRMFSGNMLNNYPNISFLSYNRYDWLKLDRTWYDETNLLLQSRLDLAYVYYSRESLDLIVGRQLINWGQTLQWNILDIFNTYSLLDFDDPVKQGSDAIRMIWYTNATSFIEFAAKLNRYKKFTTAAMSRFSLNKIELQLQTGIVEQNDWMIGAGLVSHIGQLGIRSELAWYVPLFKGQQSTILFALGTERIFSNNFAIHAEIIYNQFESQNLGNLYNRFMRIVSSPKRASFSQWSIAANLRYEPTQRFQFRLSSSAFNDYESYMLSPSIHYSTSFGLELVLKYLNFSYAEPNKRYWLNLASIGLKYDL